MRAQSVTVEYTGSDMCASLSKFRKKKYKNVKAETKIRPVKMAGGEQGLA